MKTSLGIAVVPAPAHNTFAPSAGFCPIGFDVPTMALRHGFE